MTLGQLKVFVLVARLGSVRAAAAALDVSEPAVSQALAALRNHLGDPLISRAGSTMELTAAGQRVVGLASQIVNLASEAEEVVRRSNGAPDLLRVVTTSTLAHAVVPSLLEAFGSRQLSVEATLGTADTHEMEALVSERLTDVALGPRLGGELDSEPIMRYRLTALRAASGHDSETWLVDPTVADSMSDASRVLQRLGVPEHRVRVFPNQAAACAAAAAGEGTVLAVEHLAVSQIQRGVLVPVPLPGLPFDALWYVTTLAPDRRTVAATRFRRFLSTPDAMHAMHRADGGVPASRFKPPVYVTIWS
ncbi:MAG: LysR family transcriptional regulator [Ilumatobacteraceae bacterium]